MLDRIDRDQRNYSDRGITVCERWKSFTNFLADMGQPEPGYTLDRIENDRGYEPGNCQWADRKQQARNTRRNVVLSFDGRQQSLAAWAEEFGVSYWKLYSRYKYGWPVERMFGDLVSAM